MPAAKAYVLVDLATGDIIASYHEHERLRPGSLTKLLTALIAVTYLKPADTVTGTKQSEAAYPDNVGIEKGAQWPRDEALQALLVMSANDAAYALAQRIGGSLSAFGPIMQRSARQVGMTDDPVFHDPAGLDGSEGVDGGNYVSARDLAVAARDLLDVPLLASIVREQSYAFTDPKGQHKWLASANYQFLHYTAGAIGVKTGYTDLAGFCVIGAATRHGRTMMAVVMDGVNSDQTATDLVNEGFDTPVADEPTTDRLPKFALPSPPVPVHLGSPGHLSGSAPGQLASKGGGPAGTGRTSTRLSSSGSGAGSGRHGAGGVNRPATGSSGLAAVARTVPGALLLLLGAAALLVALAEYLKVARLRRSRPLSVPTTGRAVAWLTTLGGARRHRDDLVASYSRHERGPHGRVGSRLP